MTQRELHKTCRGLNARILFVRMHCCFAVNDWVFLGDEHLVEQPLWIAVQDLRNLRSQVIAGLAKAINDFAEVCFIYAQHLRHSVLAQAAGVDPQLKIRINITLNWHCMVTQSMFCIGTRQEVLEPLLSLRDAIPVPNGVSACMATFCCTLPCGHSRAVSHFLVMFPKIRKGSRNEVQI